MLNRLQLSLSEVVRKIKLPYELRQLQFIVKVKLKYLGQILMFLPFQFL